MGSTFGLAFQLVILYIFYFDLFNHLQHQRGICRMKNFCQYHQGFDTSSCVNICLCVDGSIFPMVTWPSFLRYVITYSKGKQRRQMAQFPALCDYIQQGRATQAETHKKFKKICGCD
jgi:hypothetical protein